MIKSVTCDTTTPNCAYSIVRRKGTEKRRLLCAPFYKKISVD